MDKKVILPQCVICLEYKKLGKDAKRGILLDEECQVDIESAFLRETVAKKYASLFHSTLHHNTGYFLQVISLHLNVRYTWRKFHICMCESHPQSLLCYLNYFRYRRGTEIITHVKYLTSRHDVWKSPKLSHLQFSFNSTFSIECPLGLLCTLHLI